MRSKFSESERELYSKTREIANKLSEIWWGNLPGDMEDRRLLTVRLLGITKSLMTADMMDSDVSRERVIVETLNEAQPVYTCGDRVRYMRVEAAIEHSKGASIDGYYMVPYKCCECSHWHVRNKE